MVWNFRICCTWFIIYINIYIYYLLEIICRIPYNGKKVDIWSLGVVLFTLIFESFPFNPEERTKHLIKQGKHPILKFPES